MEIRTKLVFAFVCVALASMLTLGFTMYGRTDRELREQTLAQLDGLADFKAEALESIVAGWHDRVGLVASRTQMRTTLREHRRTASPAAVVTISQILSDALDASTLFRELRVYDATGALVTRADRGDAVAPAGANRGDERTYAEPELERRPAPPDGSSVTRYEGVSIGPGREATIAFSARLSLDGEEIGVLHAILGTEEIVGLSSNFEGLGETGETMVVATDDAGTPHVLHPVRFADGGTNEVGSGVAEPSFPVLGEDGVAVLSLDGDDVRFAGGVTDYRGEVVWAATRFMPETGWGVVVKIDEDEQVAPIVDFRADTVRLAVTLAAFAILFGTIVGFRFAQPILTLADAAGRVRSGDLTARSGIAREDEVGLLAKTFDEMAASLEEQVELLTEFRTFFDVSLDMMCIASTDGYFKRVNAAWARELGWPEEDLLENPFVTFVHPEDATSTTRELLELARGHATIRFQNRFRRSDGSYAVLSWNAYPEPNTGRIYAIARASGASASAGP